MPEKDPVISHHRVHGGPSMAQPSVANTALGAAIYRLIEQYQPENTRLFYDPVIKDLVDTPIRVLMQFR